MYALDLPAHGDSENPSGVPYITSVGARFIERFMDALGIQSASLIGNSAGGGIAATLAIRRPSRVDRLVLVDSSGLGRPVSWLLRLTSIPIWGELFHLSTMGSDAGLIRSIFNKRQSLDSESGTRLHRIRNIWSSRMKVVEAIRSEVNLFGTRKKALIVDQLRKLEMPLLIVWGENDRVFPVSHAREATEKVPNAVVHIMGDCGHWPQMDKWDEFNQLVLTFLDNPERACEMLGQAMPSG